MVPSVATVCPLPVPAGDLLVQSLCGQPRSLRRSHQSLSWRAGFKLLELDNSLVSSTKSRYPRPLHCRSMTPPSNDLRIPPKCSAHALLRNLHHSQPAKFPAWQCEFPKKRASHAIPRSARLSGTSTATGSKPTLQEFIKKEVGELHQGEEELEALFWALQDAVKGIAKRLSHMGIEDGRGPAVSEEASASASGREKAKPMDIVAVRPYPHSILSALLFCSGANA
jgi:hypothetical protein